MALEEIEQTSSILGKQNILKLNKDNEFLKELLKATYDPFTKYFIKGLPEVEPLKAEVNPATFKNFQDILLALSSRKITGHAAREMVGTFLSLCSPIEHKWYSRVIQKDLNIGVQAKIINSSLGSIIPQFQCMLAQPFRSFPPLFIMQKKLDGKRAILDTTTGSMYTRKGHLIFGYSQIEEAGRMLGPGFVIDGEIFSGDFNRVMQKGHESEMILNVFDIIPRGVFGLPAPTDSQEERVDLLEDMMSLMPKNFPIVALDHSEPMTPRQEALIWRTYDSYVSQGFEGAMVKNLVSGYEYKRSYAWQKIKPEKDIDLKVIDIQDGKPGTKYVGLVGALIVDYNGIQVGVGSGLSDEQRVQWSERPEDIIGKTITIKYQEITKNKDGTNSLRFPVLKSVRDDK